MPGFSDYSAQNFLNYVTGGVTVPSLPSAFLALFTAAPTSDAGTGGTEVSGGAYARVQCAGSVATSAATASGTTLTFSSVPSWVVAGMTVRDITTSGRIAAGTTVISTTSTTVTISAAVTGGGVLSSDVITFSAWPAAGASSGTEPSVTPVSSTNGAIITFPTATASWGTVIAWGLYDASSSGNLLIWDYLGNYPWLPATMSTASPGVITAHAHGYTVSSTVVVSAKVGGTIPTFSQSNLTGPLVPTSPTTDTFSVTNGGTAVNTSSTGDFLVRAIQSQSIPSGVTASFPASSFALYAA